MAYRGKNLRSGDLAEQLGALLLQNVALVSPVPRTEDVGIDLVATLLRNFNGYNYIAEDSFYVQIKSSSVTEIAFKGQKVKWLYELQLPFFVASVDRKTSTIHLYCAHYLSDVFVTNPNRKEIILEFADTIEYDCSDERESIRVPLGPCVVSWSLKEVEADNTFIEKFYKLLKMHVLIAKKSIETRRVGFVDQISWDTGKGPKVIQQKIKLVKTKSTQEIAAPYLSSFLMELVLEKDLFTTRSLYCLLEKKLEYEGQFEEIGGKMVLKPFKAKFKK